MKIIDEEKFVNGATRCIYNSLEIDKALYSLFNYLKEYLPLNLLCTPVFDVKSKSLRYLALASDKGGIFIAISFKISIESQKYLWNIRNQISIFSQPGNIPILEELRSFFFKNPYFDLSENFSTLAIPLQSIYPIYGGLGLIASGENIYNEEHTRLVKLLEPKRSLTRLHFEKPECHQEHSVKPIRDQFIDLENPDKLPLRWGMTVFVNVDVE